MQISLYKGILPTPTDNREPKYIIDNYILEDGLNTKLTIERIRKEKSKTRKGELKKTLPAVTWSGNFSTRKNTELIEYSGILCADIDGIEINYANELKEQMQADAYVSCAFVSPSGGLKVLFTTNQPAENHLHFFDVVQQHCKDLYNVDIDIACKDVSRLCFICYDANAYINYDSEYIFTAETKLPKQPKKNSINIPPSPKQNFGFDKLAKCYEIACKSFQPIEGQRNKYIGVFALQANRYGVDATDCANYLELLVTTDRKEIISSVNYVYKNNTADFDKYNIEYLAKKTTTQKVNFTGRNLTTNYNTNILFWYILEDEKTKKKDYKFSYDDAIEFLQNNGFFKYRIDKGKYSLIRVDEVNKIVDIINELQVKEFFIDFLKQPHKEIAPTELKAVREMFRRGAKNYCSTNLLEGLEYYAPNLKKDTQTTAYVYFKNCFLKITKDGAEPTPYKDLDGFIWEKQIINFDYSKTDYTNFDFTNFLIYAITGMEQSYSTVMNLPPDATDKKKFTSLISSLGYMVHNYKNPALTKAVVAVDSKKRTHGESNGRSGKTLIAKAIAKMANMCLIDGKNFKFDYEFAFDRVNADTKFINFNDVTKNFDFEKLFGLITEDFIYNKKKLDSITIPFADSPKIYVSTNYTLKGDGESMLGRQQIIEVSNFFTSTKQPINVFGKMFFNDWDNNDYNCFYNLFCDCIKFYLQNGLLKFPLENYAENKLIDTAGEDFIEYMKDIVLDQINTKQEYDKKQLYETYKTNNSLQYLKSNTFSKYLEMWAHINNLEINAHKQGARDRRNNIEYITFTPPRIHAQPATTDVNNKIDLI